MDEEEVVTTNTQQEYSASDIELLKDLLPEYYNPDTMGPMLKEVNWDEDFASDIRLGKGFIVTEKPFDAKTKKKTMNGTHSPRFGTSFEDENGFAERYRCECGKLIGKIYEGQVCPDCHTKVQFVDVDLNIYAWYHINNPRFKIIQPAMYRKLESFIGKNYLADIIEFKREMDLNGYYGSPANSTQSKNPFFGIGMLEFHDRFHEIMAWFLRKKKNKQELYNNIMENESKIFASNVPVYSSVLRQVFITDEDYSYTNIDKKYNGLLANINMLNKEDTVDMSTIKMINLNLFRAQKKINTIYGFIFKIINQKEGHIREYILGGRFNFSARNVIVPDASLRAYQVKLPYLTFLELYKPEIINLLMRMENISLTMAVNLWSKAQMEFSPKVYEIMNYILHHTEDGVWILINRNPTINFGSILCVKVKEIKKDPDDLTMSLSCQVLSVLNADFDGDVLNIVSLKGKEFKKKFKKIFNPRNSIFISKNDGYCQGELIKDQAIGLTQFCVC